MEAWNPDGRDIPATARKALRRFQGDLVGLDIHAGKLLERGDADTALALFRVLLFRHQGNVRESLILANSIGHCHQLLGDALRARTCHEAVVDTEERAVYMHAAGQEAVIDSLMQLCQDPAVLPERIVAILLRLEDRLPRLPDEDTFLPLARRIWIPEAQTVILQVLASAGDVRRVNNYYLVFRDVLEDYGFEPPALAEIVRKALGKT